MSANVTAKAHVFHLFQAESGEPTGRATVRAIFADRVEVVAPRRETSDDAKIDLAGILANGLHRFRVSYPSRGFTITAGNAEAACDIAQQRYPDLGAPYAVEYDRFLGFCEVAS